MKTRVIIEINTHFNKFTERDFDEKGDLDCDLTESVEDDFHRAIHDIIEKYITDGEKFCNDVFEEMQDYDEMLPKKVRDFNDLGEIAIKIHRDKVDRKSVV